VTPRSFSAEAESPVNDRELPRQFEPGAFLTPFAAELVRFHRRAPPRLMATASGEEKFTAL
jgi:hypothetical protein